jgi:thiol:disulfide interchange protein DsbD
MRYLPRPGVWMERVKQLLGFAVLGVAVWLVGVLASSRGAETASAMLWYLLALGVACWAFGVSRHRAISWAVVLLVGIGGYFALLHTPLKASLAGTKSERSLSVEGGIPWQAYSEESLAAAVAAGQPVFVDFTADWCLNCKAYEKLVIETAPIRAAFREKGIVALKADYTNEDPVIKQALARFNRIGVPLYVLYRPGEQAPVVTDAVTQQGLLLEIGMIKGGAPALAGAQGVPSR